MDPFSGKIVRNINEVDASDLFRFTPIPKHLHDDAMRVLDGRSEATVDLRGHSQLAKFAQATRKAKRKAQRQARKRNR